MLYSGLFLLGAASAAACASVGFGLGALKCMPGGKEVRAGGGGALRCCGAGLCVMVGRFADSDGVG